MRLDRELGTLNREIIAIKDKWKIALNIDAKKVAIERLITKRSKLRDSGEVDNMVEMATNKEALSLNPKKVETITPPILKSDEVEVTKKHIEKPAHLTVSWLKNRMNRK